MIEKYIFEDINTLTYGHIKGYERMIEKIGADYLEEHDYKVANIYSMLKQDKDNFQKIAPECFSYGARRTHLLPNKYLMMMTAVQIVETLKLYKENNLFDIHVLEKWKEVLHDDKKSKTLLDRMIKRQYKMKKNSLYLKPYEFYEETNLISVKDVTTCLFPYLCIQRNLVKKEKLERYFEKDVFLSDKLMDFKKVLERINELYTGPAFEQIQEMCTLKECERIIFLEYYEQYGWNDEILRWLITLFESREKVNEMPCIKGNPTIFYVNDVRNFIKQL